YTHIFIHIYMQIHIDACALKKARRACFCDVPTPKQQKYTFVPFKRSLYLIVFSETFEKICMCVYMLCIHMYAYGIMNVTFANRCIAVHIVKDKDLIKNMKDKNVRHIII